MPEQAPEQRRRQVGKLSHPAVKLRLLRELALANKTQRQIAEEYDCAVSSVNEFMKRNAEAINDIRENAEDEFAGLWVAKKKNRIAAYEEQIAFLQERIDRGAEDDPQGALKVAQAALKMVAEEMGQLTARVAVQADVNARVQYVVEGVDTEALK